MCGVLYVLCNMNTGTGIGAIVFTSVTFIASIKLSMRVQKFVILVWWFSMVKSRCGGARWATVVAIKWGGQMFSDIF